MDQNYTRNSDLNARVYPALSWTEAAYLLTNRRSLKAYGDASSLQRGNGRFQLCDHFEDFVTLVNDGWQEGAAGLATAELVRPDGDPDADWHLAPAGFFPEVGAYVAGEPDCMYRLDINPDARRRVRLFTQVGYLHTVPGPWVQEYAFALAAYVRGLEATGTSVSVVGVDTPQRRAGVGCFHVRAYEIKRYDEPMMLSRVALLGHPDFLRRLVFAVRELTEGAAHAVGSHGYGVSTHATPTRRARLYAHIDAEQLGGSDSRIYLPSVEDIYSSCGALPATAILDRFLQTPFTTEK